ncbi:MAG: gliding motility-associated C-terminal domain-containing protein [Candidatus Cyclobacteriaceae bacterium M2_1C_046]
MRKYLLPILIVLGNITQIFAQIETYTSTSGNLEVEIFLSHPCDNDGDGNADNNGFIVFNIVKASGGTANVNITTGPVTKFNQFVAEGESYIHNNTQQLPAGAYGWLVSDDTEGIGSAVDPSTYPTLVLQGLDEMIINQDLVQDNSFCEEGNIDGQIIISLDGGSQALPDGGLYTYTITTDNGLPEFPLSGTFDGTTQIDFAAEALRTGLRGGNYTITVQDSFSVCSVSRTIFIDDPSPATFTLTTNSPQTVCEGNDIILTVDGSEIDVDYTAYVNGNPTTAVVTGDGTPPVIITVVASEFVDGDILTVIATNGFCTPVQMTGSVEADVIPAATANAGSDEEICSTEASFDISSSATQPSVSNNNGLLWTTSGDGSFNDATILTPIYTSGANDKNNGIVTLTLTATGNTPCPDVSDEMVLTITPTPTADAGAAAETCASTAYTVNDATVTNSGGIQWTHNGSGSLTNETTETPTYTPVAADGGNVVILTLTVTGNGSCGDAVDTKEITVTAAPTADAGADAEICEDASYIVTDATATNAAGIEWTHNGVGTITAGTETTLTPEYNPVAGDAGNIVTLTLTATGNGSCADAVDTKALTVSAAPTADAGSDEEICSIETSFSLLNSATQPTATNYSSLLWSTSGDGTFDDASLLTPVYTPGATDLANGTVTLTIQANGIGNCGDATDEMVLTIIPTPTASISSSDANNRICAGESVTFTATPSGEANYDFLLNGVSVQSGIDETYTTTALADGDEVSVVVANSAGCVDTSAVITTTVFGVTAGISSDDADNIICAGETIIFTATPSGETNYDFLVNGASVQSGTINTFSTSTLSDQDEIAVVVTGGNNCTDTSDLIIVTVNPLPAADLTSDDADNTICEGETVTFTATPSGEANYEFFINNVSLQDGTTESYSTSALTDSDEVFVTVTGTNGCTASSAAIIINVNTPPTATISSNDADNTICLGESITFTALPAGASNYNFLINGASAQDGADDAFITSSLSDNDEVSVIVTDANGCTGVSSAITVTVIDLSSTVSSDDADNTICEGETVTFTASPTGAANYEFFVNGVLAQDGTTETFASATLADSDEIYVQVTGTTGCIALSDTVVMTVNPVPSVAITSDDADNVICEGDEVTFTATPSGAADYEFFVNGISIQSGITETYITSSLADGDLVNVTVTTAAGCSATSSDILVTVNAAPDAGEDAVATVCTANDSFNLTVALNGTPEAGGTWVDLDGSGATLTGDVADFTTASTGTFNFEYTVTSTGVCPDAVAILTVEVVTEFNAGTDNTIDVCTSDNSVNLFNALLDNPDIGGTWTDNDNIGGLTGDILNVEASNAVANNSYTFSYIVSGAGCENDTSTVTVNVIAGPDAGEDGGTIVCSTQEFVNLFNILGGTPDAGGSWLDTDNSGATISNDELNTSTLTSGVYNFEYIVSGASCPNDTATVTVEIEQPLSAGGDNTVDVCENTSSFDLLASLAGTPDDGGNWTDLDGSGAQITGNTADFTGVAVGAYNYQYIVTNVICEPDTAVLTVNIIAQPYAGEDASATVCVDESTFDLTAALGGTPNTGGTWAEITASGAVISGSTADFTGVAEGTYEFEYTVTSASCGTDAAVLTVEVVSSFDAGTDNTITVCTSDAPINLFDQIGGTPDEGGMWTDNDGIGGLSGDTFDISASTADAGNSYSFTYTLSGGSCAPASSIITITVEEGPDAGSSTTVATCQDNTGLNLFAALGGTPDTGGTWADLDNIGGLSGDFLNVDASSAVQGGNYRFEYTVTGSGACGSASSIVTVSVLQDSDPACGGVTPPPTGTCSLFSVNFDNTLPSCGQENGIVKIAALTYDGSPITDYQVTLFRVVDNDTIQDIQVPNPAGDSITSRRAGNYLYKIMDFSTNLTCNGGFELPFETTVQADTVPGTIENVTCFGSSNGSVQVSVSDSETGEYYYSIDGGSEWTLLSGSRTVTGLPAGFTTILIGETTEDNCPAEVSVSIKSLYPEIKITRTIQDATCDNNDGSVKITSVTGGTGNYDYRFQGEFMEELPSDSTFDMLDGGTFIFTVIDTEAGCEKDFEITVPFPGLVQFNTFSVSPTCVDGGAQNGLIEIAILQTGIFDVGISEEQNSDPAEFFEVISEGNGNVDYTFENLDQGNYYITVVSSGAVCPNRRLVTIEEGPQKVDFTAEQVCIDNVLALRLSDLQGEKSTPIKVEIFKEGRVNPVLTENFDGIPAGNFLIVEDIQQKLGLGNYEVRISQEQTACNSGESIISALKTFSVRASLQAQVTETIMSLPYPETPTGAITVANFSGGYPNYQIAAFMDSAAHPMQSFDAGFVEVPLNSNFNYEYTFSKVPAGRYLIEVMDSLGCTIELIARVGLNTDIFIPNVFTPNGDGKNDVFFIRNLPDFDVEIIVTNRWGKKVFSTSNYENNWDGGDSPDGTYFYQVNSGGENYSGWVQILRGRVE